MKTQTTVYEAELTPSVIDTASEKVREFLTAQRVDSKDIKRYSLTVEELLLKTMEEADGDTVAISLDMGERFFRPYILLEIDGKPKNLYFNNTAPHSVLGDGILRNIGVSPEYSYGAERNRYLFHVVRKKSSPFLPLITAMALAVTVGVIGLFIPTNLKISVLENVFNPLHDTFLNILGGVAGPMIFLSIAWGIYGIGDAATLKQVGKKVLFGYIGTVCLMVVIIGWLALPFFKLRFTGNSSALDGISSIFNMVLGFVPKNIVSPFVDGNTIQIIFIAILVGLAMLFLGQKTNAIAKAVEQINYIVQFFIDFISKLVPFFIFIVLVKMIWMNSVRVLVDVGKMFVMYIASAIIMVIFIVGYTSVRNRVRPWRLIKKGLPTLIIALTTASSAAAFGTNMDACKNKLGIDDKMTSFGLPLGIVTFKPTVALSYVIISLFFAERFSLNISVSWILLMMFSASILALATPPIPGGALTAYTILFAQLGIPVEALTIALACDSILDFIATGGDQFVLPFVLLNQADKLGMVDRNILTSRK